MYQLLRLPSMPANWVMVMTGQRGDSLLHRERLVPSTIARGNLGCILQPRILLYSSVLVGHYAGVGRYSTAFP